MLKETGVSEPDETVHATLPRRVVGPHANEHLPFTSRLAVDLLNGARLPASKLTRSPLPEIGLLLPSLSWMLTVQESMSLAWKSPASPPGVMSPCGPVHSRNQHA